MQDTPFLETLVRLRQALASPLPGEAAQFRMSPEGAPSARRRRSMPPGCRQGAVMVLLYPRDGEAVLILTRRPDSLPDHPGQISLPGGRRDDGEELIDTARRECLEEVGIDPSSIDMLGALSPLYIPVSDYGVYPFVGAVAERPLFRPNPNEVSEIIEAPVARLRHRATVQHEPWLLHGAVRSVPFYALDGHRVWGATAMILAEFVALLENPNESGRVVSSDTPAAPVPLRIDPS